MKELFRKWWVWLIIILIVLLLLPIWCNTYYLPGINQTVTERTSCGTIFELFKVY